MTPRPNATPPPETNDTGKLIAGSIVTALLFGLMILETVRLAIP